MTMRAGYDDDGNYRFVPTHPLEDQCPECRAAPGAPHADGCPGLRDSRMAADSDVTNCTHLSRSADSSTHVSQSGNFPASGNMNPVNIPLEVQERLFNKCWCDAMNTMIALAGNRIGVPDDLLDLALARLRSGFEQYGSEMYTWDAETRRRNVMEELADAIVYLTSGPVE
jgi:hypothetical protein